MKVLIADKFSTAGVAQLESCGCAVSFDPSLKDDALRDAIRETACQVLVVRGTKVTGEMLEASAALAVVVRAGAGYNSIDVHTASRRSILVANCPGKNAVAVAELTFALILALDRRLVEGVNDLRAGTWNKSEYSKAKGLKGRTLGVVGVGQIGQAVVRRALGMEMNVLAWSRSLTDETAADLGVTRCATILDLAAGCDVLSIHLAATADTAKIIDAAVLERLRPGSYVINTARAEVMDYAALQRAVEQRDLRVGLDVFPDEPATGSAPFASAIVQSGGVVYGTHHVGASTEQAQEEIAAESVRIVLEYKRTGAVLNCVNLRERSGAHYVLVVRHRNRPGVLAHTLNQVSKAGINVAEMENLICSGAEAACAQIKLDGAPDEDALNRIADHDHIFSATVSPIRE